MIISLHKAPVVRYFVVLILLALCQAVLAQDFDSEDKDRQYVTDQLRLSLYKEANSQSSVIKLLRSGDMLIVDEIRGPYALVTAPDGSRGWVKRGFLVRNPTANILLREEQQKSASLFDELEKLENSKIVIDAYEKDMDDLMAKIENLEASKLEANETIARLKQELAAAQMPSDDSMPLLNVSPVSDPMYIDLMYTLRDHWKIIAPLVLVIVLLTFLISKLAIEARIKSRFHGIKIW